jgi:hypothetical protein
MLGTCDCHFVLFYDFYMKQLFRSIPYIKTSHNNGYEPCTLEAGGKSSKKQLLAYMESV